jgi:hypothetical protein
MSADSFALIDEYLDEKEIDEPIATYDECCEETCPMCNGLAYGLGVLGWTQYYRCQDCGWQFSL